MLEFSASVGFLWPELSMPERIRTAAAAGFAAVECHLPYDTPVDHTRRALQDTGLRMLSLNTVLGTNGQQDFGVAARADRVAEARSAIGQAIEYASAINCANVNIVPGKTGRSPNSESTFRKNLTYACHRANEFGMGILIEPINTRSAPDFHLSTVDQAIETIEAVNCRNLKLIFDCFHVQIMQGDLVTRFKNALSLTGHVQISAVHDRGEPDRGEVDYGYVLQAFEALGWSGFIGAEYQPRTTTEAGLGWMQQYNASNGHASEIRPMIKEAHT